MQEKNQSIIHLDMDCFFAAIEERDQPQLRGQPIGVAGSSQRGVLTTANYPARKFGCRSAMPVHEALRFCPQLIIMPVRFEVYRQESHKIRALMEGFTSQIEPLSLDEAYLDVSHRREPAAEIAQHLRQLIAEDLGLTASAGIGPNKLLAKIASDMNKPDGQLEVPAKPKAIQAFLDPLPVGKLWGVGPKMRQRLEKLGVQTCADLHQLEVSTLAQALGRQGLELRQLAQGIDERPVQSSRERKSVSVETTLHHDLSHLEELELVLQELAEELAHELEQKHAKRQIHTLVFKLKFADFSQTTAERASQVLDRGLASELLAEARQRQSSQAVRLLGIGVKFVPKQESEQPTLFKRAALKVQNSR